MKGFFVVGGVLLSLSFFVSPALAATDQHCLQLCVNNGNPSTLCLANCTYDTPSEHKAPSPIEGSQHSVFSTPAPTDAVILSSSKPKPVAQNKDYVCLNQCLKTGSQYNLCSASCTKQPCKPGSVLCENLTGTVPVNPAFSGSLSPLAPTPTSSTMIRPGVVGN